MQKVARYPFRIHLNLFIICLIYLAVCFTCCVEVSCPTPRHSLSLSSLSICSAFLCANVYARFMAPKDKEKQSLVCGAAPRPQDQCPNSEEKTLIHFQSLRSSLSGFCRSILRKETRSSGAHRWVRSPRCQQICLRCSTAHANWQFGHNWTKIHCSSHNNPRLCRDPSFCGV